MGQSAQILMSDIVLKAKSSCETSGHKVSGRFADVGKTLSSNDCVGLVIMGVPGISQLVK